jgi:hypothetical protein
MNPHRPRANVRPTLKWGWLACKRHNLPRDLRKLLVRLVHVHDWRWAYLEDRMYAYTYCRLASGTVRSRRVMEICDEVQMTVVKATDTGGRLHCMSRYGLGYTWFRVWE